MHYNRLSLVAIVMASCCVLSADPSSYRVVQNPAALPILTPALQDRSTEKLILSNGLQVLLISDPGADQSAAGMAVEVGSWDDPQEYPGMAHFLEHMLFMGTKAYPRENEYMQFIHDHGGTVNAFTASDRTVYMLSINNESFEEAVDRFSHFFIDPLFQKSCINRELHAVDQEHSKNIEHDGWRYLMVFKETSNPAHPMHAFSTGNAQTLSGIPQSAVKTWYDTHYSADRMHLVLISPLSIEEMRAIVIARFSAVPKVATVARQTPSQVMSTQQKGHMFFIKPIKDVKQLSLEWEVPASFAEDIDRQVPNLVAYALQRDDEQSLSQLLKKEKIAESISVSCDRLSKQSMLFSIDITLTDQGLRQVDAIISYLFEAIARLKKEGYPAHLFNEVQMMAKLDYQFQSREEAFTLIQNLAASLPDEDLLTYPEKLKIPTLYDPASIQAFVELLNAADCRYVVLADPEKTQIPVTNKEKWCQAEYTVKPVSKARIAAWNALSPNSQIVLPSPNPYLPSRLDLVTPSTFSSPILLDSTAGASIYYATDSRYKVPEVVFLFDFKSPLLTREATSKALSDLYTRAFLEKLSPTLTLASAGGLSCNLGSSDEGMSLQVMGYSDKAPLLLSTLFDQLPSLVISKEEFEVYRTSLASLYDNASKELPVKQAMQQLDSLLLHNPSPQEKLQAIRAVSYEQFAQFCKGLFEKVYTEGMLYGNISSEEAKQLWTSLQAKIGSAPFTRQEQLPRKIFVLNDQSRPCKIVESTDRQGSGALLLIQEGPFSFSTRASQQVLGYVLSDAFFDTLRTKQQTGYIAKAWASEEERQLLQFFAVQSATYNTQDLLARFDLFLEEFNRELTTHIPEGRFESVRSNLITLLKMPPENMRGRAEQLDLLAFEYADFSWLEKRIAALQALSYESFCQEAHRFLKSPQRIALLMQGVLPADAPLQYQTVSSEEIMQLGSFEAMR